MSVAANDTAKMLGQIPKLGGKNYVNWSETCLLMFEAYGCETTITQQLEEEFTLDKAMDKRP
jgi:hypothetical protein